jgi:hypothetical protein
VQQEQQPTTTGATEEPSQCTGRTCINAQQDVIDLAASTTEYIYISYSYGTAPLRNSNNTGNSKSQPTATVSGGTFCATGTTTITTTGATGGTFSAPAGLVINATTGVINLGTSTPGAYTITIVMEQRHAQEQQPIV